jgi:hypothetical protein
MSVQLIVYPQSFEGIPNAISVNSPQMVANPIDFSAVTAANSVSLGSVANLPQAAINAIQPTIVPNTWTYGWAAGGSATNGSTTGIPIYPYSALLQNLGNLVVNGVYDLDISWSIYSGSAVGISIFNGTILTNQIFVPSATLVSTQFTAQSINGTTIVISYTTQSGGEVIQSVQANFATVQPSGAIQNLEHGQVICDLYEDEDIPLSLSVDDFKNVAEKVQSYSKAFNLPATKRNNRIFDNIFEITRSDDGVIFNPYKKTQCVLKQDGFILFEGYLRMLDVTEKEGEISYNVNLYSEVVALADVLGDRTFSDLDFTELEHDYNYSEIRNTWVNNNIFVNPSTSGFRSSNTVKYPFVSWNQQYGYTSAGMPKLPNLESSFRPFINIKYLIDRIFQATPFTYESEFFDTDDFKKLYMDFNWGSDNAPVVFNTSASGDWDSWQSISTSWTTIEFPINTFSNMPELPYSLGVFTATYDNQMFSVSTQMVFDWWSSANSTLNVEWVVTDGSGVETIYFASGNQYNNNVPYIYQASFFGFLQTGDTLHCRAIETGSNMVLEDDPLQFMNITTSSSETTNETLLDTLRGELGQWDFLKGILTMFNLVTLVDEENSDNILIEPYSDVFIPTATGGTTLADRGVEHDWTEKIDVSEMKLTPLTDLNKKTIFKFVEDDDDYSFNQYKNQVGGHLYGSKKYNAGDEFNILFGEDEIVAEPFAATVVKPLMPEFSDLITPAIYSYSPNDDTSEGFDNSPRIMYNNGVVTMASTTYSVPAQNGVAGDASEDEFLQFSHLSDVPTILATPSVAGSSDFHFGECQLMPGVGSPVPNNLFNLYWLPYYSELYNPNTRIMTIKVNLSPADINTFKFNDTVYIKNRVFRVNKIDYKPNDLATVEFILIP